MKVPEFSFSNYIFVVTGMSYIIDSSGTSKVVKAHEDIFKKDGIGYIVVFPISRSRGEGAKWHCTTTGCYGMAIDGQFVGVITAVEVLNNLLKLNNCGKKCLGVLIHHIIRNDISEIEWMLSKIQNVPIAFYLHDFYTCCTNPYLMKNDVQSCINRDVSCDGCCYLKKRKAHIEKISHFLNEFEKRITFVAPSEYTKNRWLTFYPEYANKITVILHQKAMGEYIGNKEVIGADEPLRMGFVGAQKQIKGWDIFKKLVVTTQKAGCNYDLYYFGNGKEKIEGVKYINVDIASQGKDAMIKNLQEKRISAVFLVCVCGETYSYTTYESHAANCYIFAMNSGGNIPYTVNKNNWGRVFTSESELIKNILDERKIRKEINNWKKNAKPGAAKYLDNDKILDLFQKDNDAKIYWDFEKIKFPLKIKCFFLKELFVRTRL